MKKVSIFFVFLITTLFTTSCDKENYTIKKKLYEARLIFPSITSNSYTTNELPSGGRIEEGIYDFLAFEKWKDFSRLIGMNANNLFFHKEGKKNYSNFHSLENQIENIYSRYDAILDRYVKLYPNTDKLPSKVEKQAIREIENLITPYSSIISYSKEAGIDRKTYSIIIDALLNKDGIVKIEDKIYQYTLKYVKIINDGDQSKIPLLKGITETSKSLGIEVIPTKNTVDRIGQGDDSQDDKSYYLHEGLSSCSNTNGGFRMYAYEDKNLIYTPATDTQVGTLDIFYFIKLRSLRKVFFTWQNRPTKQHHSQGSYTANFNPATAPTVSYSTPPLQDESHTYIYSLASLTTSPIYSFDDAESRGTVYSSSHAASGAHDTSCNFGF